MKQIEKIVSLVKVPKHLSADRWPHVLDYENQYIQKIVPCAYMDGQYFDLRTGEQVEKDESCMLEWNVLTGNVFQYPDGEMLLISRRFDNNRLLVLRTTEVRPTMILRKVK